MYNAESALEPVGNNSLCSLPLLSTSTTTSTQLLFIPYFYFYVITSNAWVSFFYSQLVDVSLQPKLLLLLEYQEGDLEESEQGPDRCTLLQEESGVREG